MVAAGLEGDVGGGSFCREASLGGLLEGYDLGVVVVVVEVRAFADDFWGVSPGADRVRTQPTWGLGEARATVSAASLRARCMKTSSCVAAAASWWAKDMLF